MRVLLAILIFICSAKSVNSQIYFNNSFDINGGVNFTTTAIEFNGGYYFISRSRLDTVPSINITELDFSGNLIFTKRYFYSDKLFNLGLSHSLSKTIDGNLIFCGQVIDTLNNVDAFVMKFDMLGDTLWTKTFGGAGFDCANAIYQLTNGSFFVICTTDSYGNGGTDFWRVIIDSVGDVVDSDFYGSSGAEIPYCGDITTDGGMVISGVKNNFPYLVKVDSVGNQQWVQSYNLYGDDYCFVSEWPSGGYIIATRKITSQLGSQACLIRTNSLGTVIWTRQYGQFDDEYLFCKPIILDDNSIVVSGEIVPSDGSSSHGFVLKADSMGNQIWLREYSLSSVVNDLYDIQKTSDNGFLLAGSTFINTQDSWLVKIDSMGCEVAGCDPASIPETEFSEFNLYPNPNNGAFTIELNTAAIADVYVYDAIGQLVSAEKVQPHVLHQMNLLNSGAYMITVVTADGQRTSKRVIVTR